MSCSNPAGAAREAGEAYTAVLRELLGDRDLVHLRQIKRIRESLEV